MNRIVFALVFCVLSLNSVAQEDPQAGVSVDPKTFFNDTKGTYEVLKSGGNPAHDGDLGTVEIEETQAVLSFSFCPPSGGCDPNYVFLEYDKTKITMSSPNDGGTHYDIESEDMGAKTRYTWTVKNGLISLKNYQYVLDGKIVTLEHQLRKKQ